MEKKYPICIYGKRWILWAITIIFGGFACFCCIAGPLFWTGVFVAADRRPRHEAGIPLTVAGLVLIPLFMNSLFQLYARYWPLICIYKEGLQIRTIATPLRSDLISDILGITLILIVFVAAWQLITLQMFRTQTFYLPWENLMIRSQSGTLDLIFPLHQNLSDYEEEQLFFSYNQNSFNISVEKAKKAILYYKNPASRESLQSWEKSFSPY